MMRTRTAATLPTIDEVKSAADSVYRVMHPTPHYCWPLLCERLGTEAWVKHENQTPTGSFKARTAVVYVEELMKRAPQTRGLVTATRGNHGNRLHWQRSALRCRPSSSCRSATASRRTPRCGRRVQR